MRNRLCLATAALFAAAASAHAQGTFKNYVAVGDSLTAGYMSGSLVETHQVNSYPALIARQGGATDFQQPLVSEPGIPTELALLTLLPGPLIAPKFPAQGVPINTQLPRPYNNLGVPGATSVDCLATTSGGFHDLVLRGLGTAVQQAMASSPSFITLWIGNNDVLGAAVNGQAIDGVTLVPAATFREVYTQIVAALKSTGAPIVAANLPDVTSIPFVTTIPRVVVNPTTRQPVLVDGQPVPLVGPNGPLPPGSYVTLGASSFLAKGIGIPAGLGGTGVPLPDNVVLDPTEVATIRDRVAMNNLAIADICAAAKIPVLDVNAILREISNQGRDLGGVNLSSAFLTGGVFSYDGVHLTDLGYAIVANEWIALINKRGGTLPLVNLAPYFGLASSGEGGRVMAAAGRREVVASGAAALAPRFEFSEEAYRSLVALFPRLDRR
jgi:lysophospholipase L1-like esterase